MEHQISTAVDFDSPAFIFPCGARWREIQLTGNLEGREHRRLPWDKIRANIDQAEIKVNDWRCLRFKVVGRSILIELDAQADEDTYTNFGIGPAIVYMDRFELIYDLFSRPIRSIRAQVADLSDQLTNLFKNGTADIMINASAEVHFNLDGRIARIRLACVTEAGRTRLNVNRADMARVGDMTEDGLTHSELDLLEAYPARALKILMAQRYAANKARIAHHHDPRVPEDAYRHVLWSYLLTKDFGAEFAHAVVSAHETGINKKSNSESEHAMDLSNNLIGIKIASEGFSENTVLDQVLSRRDIIRSANSNGPSNSSTP